MSELAQHERDFLAVKEFLTNLPLLLTSYKIDAKEAYQRYMQQHQGNMNIEEFMALSIRTGMITLTSHESKRTIEIPTPGNNQSIASGSN